MSCAIVGILCLLVLRAVNVQANRDFPHNEPPSEPEFDWQCGSYDPNDPPLFTYLWCNSIDLANKSYETPFIQKIKSGLLNPVKYSAFDIQDAWWLVEGSKSYSWVCAWHSCDDEQEKFFTHVSKVYLEYGRDIMAAYRSPVSTVIPNAAADAYAHYEFKRAGIQDPKYSVVLATPCLALWPAIAQRLKKDGALKHKNVYKFWIKSNSKPGTSFAKAKALLNNKGYEYDRETALGIFRSAMAFEAEFFAMATVANSEATTQITV